MSSRCVSNHISNVMQKLNVKGRSRAVVELIKLGELKI
ncbi:response regulator transcription factor [Paenibacillus lemnae]|uniref:Response regulator transcription factor n=1 Tax=Paenibacillus lemnae TaxID=1330551 RepID=A0A848M2X0_PAELE|nr:response regulator transcription factor [Paenibacillus lemnae]